MEGRGQEEVLKERIDAAERTGRAHPVDKCTDKCHEPRLDAQHVLRMRAADLRREAAGIDALADALPAGLSRISPIANDALVGMFGQAHRVYLGRG